jgi:hypothetical protein
MCFNLLTLSVPYGTPGCFSICWLWAYLMLLQDVFQSFDFERTWRYSRMFFNLLTLSVPDVTPGCFSICWIWAPSKSADWKASWSNVRYAQSQNIEKHPGVTSGTLKVNVTPWCFSICWLWAYLTLFHDVFQSFDFERTLTLLWRYSRMLFNPLTLSIPDVTPGCFSIFWFWAYLTLL